MTLAIDLNVSPPPLFDLNKYPEENHGGEATPVYPTHENIGQVVGDLDLNLTPQQDMEEDQSIRGAPSANGKFCLVKVVLFYK